MAVKHWFTIFVWVMLLLCKFFLWFFNGSWPLGIMSHGIPSSALGRQCQGTMYFGTRSSLTKKEVFRIFMPGKLKKPLPSHSLKIWRLREHAFFSQPRMRNHQTVLLFCSVWILLTLSLWGQDTLSTVVFHLKHRNLQAPSQSALVVHTFVAYICVSISFLNLILSKQVNIT